MSAPCICPPSFCFGVPGDSDDNPQICLACMALDPEEGCLSEEEACFLGVSHDWAVRPESDTWVCETCGVER